MTARHRRGASARRLRNMLLLAIGAGWLVACGTIGPAVAPETIGVNAKRQKDLEEQGRLQREAQQRREQPESRTSPPIAGAPAGPSPEAQQQGLEEGDFPEKITDPSARPSGDVQVRPR
ncbi:MAG: hypothetical protein ACREJU_16855 [Nitrospiraceae bacterium]